ncbi:MAG: FecR family protein, partial [Thermodesulfobacteriota bacterium]
MPEAKPTALGHISEVEGTVKILRAAVAASAPKPPHIAKLPTEYVKLKDELFVGDSIITIAASRVEIVLLDESVIRLAPDSELLLEEYLLDGNTRKRGVLKLLTGKVRAMVIKAPGLQPGSFELNTHTATTGVRGTDFFVSYNNDASTDVLVLEGKVAVYNRKIPKKIALVTDGNTTTVTKTKPPTKPRKATMKEKS